MELDRILIVDGNVQIIFNDTINEVCYTATVSLEDFFNELASAFATNDKA